MIIMIHAIPFSSWRTISIFLVYAPAAIQSPRMVAAEPSPEKGANRFTEWKTLNGDRFAWGEACAWRRGLLAVVLMEKLRPIIVASLVKAITAVM
ncbi:MAG: hypothetical protein ACOC2L_01300 [Candidatus Sumerlaeota bacterium]